MIKKKNAVKLTFFHRYLMAVVFTGEGPESGFKVELSRPGCGSCEHPLGRCVLKWVSCS